MARIRTTKPEFWTSEQIMAMSRDARLLFIGMWNFCDDAGIHPAKFKTLKVEVFPGDEIDVAPLVQEIAGQGLLVEYETGGERYWHVTGWHHQKIDRPNYKHPLPDGSLPERYEDVRRAFDEYSSNERRALTPGREGKGRESSGEERSLQGRRGAGRELEPPPGPLEGEALFPSIKGENPLEAKSTITIPLSDGQHFVVNDTAIMDFTAKYPWVNVLDELGAMTETLACNPGKRPNGEAEAVEYIARWLANANDFRAPKQVPA